MCVVDATFLFSIIIPAMTKLIPLEDRVLVEALEEETTSPSGIILPDTNKEKPSKGKVIAVGQGKILADGQRGAMDVKEGDIVHFTKYAPDEIEMGEDKYLIIKHDSILAIEK